MKTKILNVSNPTKFTGALLVDKYLSAKGLDERTYDLLQNPPAEHSPWLLKDMVNLVDSLYIDAIAGTKICIIGDYDADGVTSTTILYLLLKEYNANVHYIIPDRIKDGYGLSKKLVDKAESMYAAEAILTCDNGIVAYEAVEYAKSKGMKVYVTDHHEPQETLPDADVIIHPALGNYPFASISGCEVTYKVAQAMLEKYPLENAKEQEDLLNYFLQLAGISIVSDVMPVGSFDYETMKVNENRCILKKAIAYMRKSIDPRINSLLECQAVHHKFLDETMIGFNVSPIINACGRLANAEIAVDLLTSDNPRNTELCSAIANNLNRERKAMTSETLDRAIALVDDSKPILVIRTEAHEGLVGIVAGKIAEQFQKPTIVFSEAEVEDENGIMVKAWKGSARSNSIDIFETLNKIDSKLLYKFGGHAGAAGMTILDESFEDFEKQLIEIVEKNAEEIPETELEVIQAPILHINAAAKALEALKPFGNGFPKPVIETVSKISQVDFFYSSGHVKLSYWSPATGSIELWLYGELDNFKRLNPIPKFSKTMDNITKKRKEGLTEEEAWNSHWERWKNEDIRDKDGNLVEKVFPAELDMVLELDYGVNFSTNMESVLTRPIKYGE